MKTQALVFLIECMILRFAFRIPFTHRYIHIKPSICTCISRNGFNQRGIVIYVAKTKALISYMRLPSSSSAPLLFAFLRCVPLID